MPRITSLSSVSVSISRDSDQDTRILRPRRSLRLPEETHPNYSTVCRWDSARSKLKHISQVAAHPQLARKQALRDSTLRESTRKEPLKEQSSGDLGSESKVIPPEAANIIERLRSHTFYPSAKSETTSKSTEPELLSYTRTSDSPRWNRTRRSSSMTFESSKKDSKSRLGSGRQKPKNGILNKVKRSQTFLMEVLRESGEVLKARASRRKVKNLKDRRRISIPEVEILKIRAELEETPSS